MKHVPNALTLLRLVLAPVIAWLMWEALEARFTAPSTLTDEEYRRAYDLFLQTTADTLTLAAILFVVAALTDLFDGMIARRFNAHSKFGRLIDPIADKALVGLPLIVGSVSAWRHFYWLWPIIALASAVIVIRDITMTVIRLRAADGEGARVSLLAKIKTSLELVVIGSLLVVLAIYAHMQVQAAPEDQTFHIANYRTLFEFVWIALLVITAALSAYTGWQYLRPKPKR